jgi:hypothetical protein
MSDSTVRLGPRGVSRGPTRLSTERYILVAAVAITIMLGAENICVAEGYKKSKTFSLIMEKGRT